jgi:hypothetical protein
MPPVSFALWPDLPYDAHAWSSLRRLLRQDVSDDDHILETHSHVAPQATQPEIFA